MTIGRLQQELYQRPGHAPTRQQLAIAYNNYGVELSSQGQWQLAQQQFEQALRLEGESEQIRTNFANMYLNVANQASEQHDFAQAKAAIEQATRLNANLAPVYRLLGEIEYSNQRLKEAKAAWERSLGLDPAQQDLAERLAQVEQELPVESKFERLSQAYFDLRYQEEFERPVGFDVRDALLEARRVVGSDFAYWPKHKIVVLIYSAEEFRLIRQETPDWVAGQFDGKIRVPLPSSQLDQTAVKQIIFHEYTHALIHDLTRGKCPKWLNEGLAEYEGRRQQPGSLNRLATAHRSGTLIPWRELSDHIATNLPVEDVALAYEQSYSIVEYLINRYGFWRMRRILKEVGEGKPWDEALAAQARIKLSRLEAVWSELVPEFLRQRP